MIGKQEVINAATILKLNPHIVEKDYVLGWLLWGIANHESLGGQWIFKGGTCIKKCFLDLYRFSEDLDFTLIVDKPISEDFLKQAFSEIGESIYDQTGIEFPTGNQSFDIYLNPRGNMSCEGKIGYRGPISPTGKNMPRIRIDLTADECVVLPPIRSSVSHPYSDSPKGGINIQTYTYEEVYGEKIRALTERTRPRDLYDVVNLYRNEHARPAASVLRDVIRQKCEYKGIEFPCLADIERRRIELEGGWDSMLTHQLPVLPPIDGFLAELRTFFAWLEGNIEPPSLPPLTGLEGEHVLRGSVFQLPVSTQTQANLESIRFAASNHLCVDLTIDNSARRIEPYSLLGGKDGVLLLYGLSENRLRSYPVNNIQTVEITNQAFLPSYRIDLMSIIE